MVRERLKIPEAGFPDGKDALRWYKDHFEEAKATKFRGSFGFRYNPMRNMLDFEYKDSHKGLWIAAPAPLDLQVPLDREAAAIASNAKLPEWAAPALRLVLLIGQLPEKLELLIPHRFIAPLGNFRVLVHPSTSTSTRQWSNSGEMMGLLPSKVDMWQVPGNMTTYGKERQNNRQNKRHELYWQVLMAYRDAISERRMHGKKGKWRLLKETGQILKDRYGWDTPADSYTVRRYLDRAEKIWHFSTY